jgi:hypothetical protein
VELHVDHGFEVDATRHCRAVTKKGRQCTLNAIAGIDLCALHAGLARGKGKPGFGDVRALDAYKRRIASGIAPPKTPATPR